MQTRFPSMILRWPIRATIGLVKVCAALPLAIALMALLTVVLALGTCIEHWYGAAAARFGIYGAWWFAALAALLALNIFAAMLVRLPWRRRQTGFVLTHFGLLLLLAGCLLARRGGIEAHLPVWEGRLAWQAYQDSDHFELTQADAELSRQHAKPPTPRLPIAVPFTPGPFSGKTTGSCRGFLGGWPAAMKAYSTTATASVWKCSTTTATRGRFRCRGCN